MNDWLNKPWVIRFISLFLAVLTFLMISFDNQDTRSGDIGTFDSFFNSSQETVTLEGVPVSIQIDDSNYVVSGVPETVTMALTGTVSVVQSTATQRNFDVFVDLEDMEPGQHTVPIQYEGISNRITVDFTPEFVEVSIEERGSNEYTVEVDYSNRNEMPPGFEVESATVTPEVVRITSSQGMIDRVSSVKAFVDLEGISESLTLTDVPVRVYDNEGNQLNVRVEPSVVSVDLVVVTPNITVPITLQTENELPDDVRLVSLEIEGDDSVQLFGPSIVLDMIEEVTTESLDLSTITESTTETLTLNIPTGIEESSQTTVTVTIEVEEETEVTFEDLEIEFDNLEGGFEAEFIDPESGTSNVSLLGFPSDLEGFTSSDIRLFVDLSQLESGEYTQPIVVEGPEDLNIDLPFNEVTLLIQ